MGYVWDPNKAATNLSKHGVDFADAVTALEDDLALSMPDSFAESETRSAREAEPKERRQYEEQP